MIESITYAWFAAGLMAGLRHAARLWLAAHRLTAWTPALGILRLGVVAAVMVAAVRSAAILTVVVGWTVGFVALGIWFLTRSGSAGVAPSLSQLHDHLGT